MRDVEQAETHPALRAIRDEYDRAQDNPGLAWKFLERLEWADDEPLSPTGPIVIQLEFPESERPPDS